MSYTGADLIADALAQLGVEHVFGIVSIHNMPMMDAINRLGKTKIIDFAKVVIVHDTVVNSMKRLSFCCIHLKIMLLEPQNSTPLSGIRNWMAILSREFEGQVANLQYG